MLDTGVKIVYHKVAVGVTPQANLTKSNGCERPISRNKAPCCLGAGNG